MDFSSIPRALESLRRRTPTLPLAPETFALARDCESSSQPERLVELVPQLLLKSDDARWEALAVGLYCATELLTEALKHQKRQQQQEPSNASIYMDGPRVPDATVDAAAAVSAQFSSFVLSDAQARELCTLLHPVCMEHLEHAEPRIRTQVAKAVGAYCRYSATASADLLREERRALQKRLVDSIDSHIRTGRAATEQAAAANDNNINKDVESKVSKSSTGALDDTTGWRALETNWQCLATLVRSLGPRYFTEFAADGDSNNGSSSLLDDTLLQHVVYSSVTHLNRHVRAASMACLEQFVIAAAAGRDGDSNDSACAVQLLQPGSKLRATCLEVLKAGLADNWSQVRMAASVLCRVLLMTLTHTLNISADDMYPTLLPRMCLNRFYLAQGVKLYSHETWKLVFTSSGLPLVVQYLPAVVRYYIRMCDADNHVVREGSCQALAELATRIGSAANSRKKGYDSYNHDDNDIASNLQAAEKLQPHVPAMLQALLMCFHDESWPVRDEACLACGLFVRAFPEECRPELPQLWECWTNQLRDPIWSVREDAAVALGDALSAYGSEYMPKLLELIQSWIPMARTQPTMTRDEYKALQNNVQAHTENQLYSCGSLAPKLKKKSGAGRIGCSSCDVNREPAPWESTDGVIYLLREMVYVCNGDNNNSSGSTNSDDRETPTLDDAVLLPLLTELADVCRVQHFPQADDLRQTLWRSLPSIAQDLGKQRFKNIYLELFLDLLFRNLEKDHSGASALSVHAAEQCLEALSDLIGARMFRARLMDDPRQQAMFDRVLRERANLPPPVEFSPFGPPGLLDHVNNSNDNNTGGVGGISSLQQHPSVALRWGGSASVMDH